MRVILQMISVTNESFGLNIAGHIRDNVPRREYSVTTSVSRRAEEKRNIHISPSYCHCERDGNCQCRVMLDEVEMGYAMLTQLAMTHWA